MIKDQISAFNDSLIAHREFVSLIDPFLNKRKEEFDKNIQPIVFCSLIDKLLSSNKEWKEGEKEEILGIKSNLEKNANKDYLENLTVDLVKKDGEGDDSESEILIKVGSNDILTREKLESAERAENHIDLLYTNSLISVLSSVEWYFSQLLHFYYEKYPDSSGVNKRTLTLTELKAFGSVQDAEKYLVDLKIEEILRGSFDSWVNLLSDEFKLGLNYLNDIKTDLIEIYQRRNLLVHNGGIVNSIYLSKVKDSQRQNIKLGCKVLVDKAYLDYAMNNLEKGFILIGAELWKKISLEDQDRAFILNEIVYDKLLESKWDVARSLSLFVIKDTKCDPIDKVVAQLNYWLCEKEMDRFDHVKKEVEEANYSDKNLLLQLGLYALKIDVVNFFKTLEMALDSDQFTIELLEEFPIMKEIRKTDEYAEFKKNSGYFVLETDSEDVKVDITLDSEMI